MIDLKKEFRTLRLLSSALIIIGGGLALCGFGVGLVTHDSSKPAPPVAIQTPPENPAEPPAPPRKKPVQDVKLTS